MIPSLLEHHAQEWLASGVDPDLIQANVVSLSGNQPYDYLFYSDRLDRRNDGRVAQWVLNRYRHVEAGGWWCAGEDLVELKKQVAKPRIAKRVEQFITIRSLWGQFKPDQPFIQENGKTVKYEPPPKTETRVFALSHPSHPRFWLNVLADPTIPIIITEGAKKAGCLMTLGYATVALPGIYNGYRKESQQLIEDIAVLCAPGRPIYICFDHDQKENTQANVRIATSQLGRLLSKAGCNVSVISLPGPEKGVDDFVVAQGAAAFHALFKAALPLYRWETQRFAKLTYQPSVKLHQEFLGNLTIPQGIKLVGIKARKGGGKTEALIDLVAEAMAYGQRVLLLTHRVQLGQAICQRVGLQYVTEIYSAAEGGLLGYGVCVDSLHPESQARFNADEWKEALVVIDEAEQVIWHLLNASTEVKTHRLSILRQLRQVLQQTLESETGKILLLDADLTDVSLNFVLKLSQIRVKPWIVVNTWNSQIRRTCWHYKQTNPGVWYTALNAAVDAGKRLFIVLQSQKASSKWSARNLEKDLLKRHPNLKILRIDSETIADPQHPACGAVAHLNDIIQQYDLVIATPAIETGVSIDVRGHFDSVWGCFWGVSSANSARQALARVRDDCDRHVWIASYGVGRIANGATSKFGLLRAQTQIVKAAIARLKQDVWDFEHDEFTTNDAALNTWAEMACRINAEMIHYRECILDGLKAEGYTIQDGSPIIESSLIEALEQTRSEEYAQERTDEAEIEMPTDSQAETLDAKKLRTKEERLKLKKWKRYKKYGVPVTPELIEKDDAGWFPQLQLHYYLSMGKQFVLQRDTQALAAAANEGELWFPTFTRSEIGTKTQLLNFLNIQGLLDADRDFKNSDPDLIERKEKALPYAQAIKNALGITITEKDSPIAIANKLLKKIGMKLTLDRKEGPRGASVRVYKYQLPDDGRAEVFMAWFQRDELSRNESAVGAERISKYLNFEDTAA